jgi:hypothetical protein
VCEIFLFFCFVLLVFFLVVCVPYAYMCMFVQFTSFVVFFFLSSSSTTFLHSLLLTGKKELYIKSTSVCDSSFFLFFNCFILSLPLFFVFGFLCSIFDTSSFSFFFFFRSVFVSRYVSVCICLSRLDDNLTTTTNKLSSNQILVFFLDLFLEIFT